MSIFIAMYKETSITLWSLCWLWINMNGIYQSGWSKIYTFLTIYRTQKNIPILVISKLQLLLGFIFKIFWQYWVWTEGVTFSRQVMYHLCYTSNPVLLYFSHSVFAQSQTPWWFAYLCPCVVGITGVYHHAWLVSGMGSC
jgi:hypothetical protein